MKRIPLTQGKFTIVDDEDFDYLGRWKWHCNAQGYATRSSRNIGGKKGVIYMHRVVNKTKAGFVTDHINRNKLDNRKLNLRTLTRGKNQWNRGLPKNNTSGFLGVKWYRAQKLWEASIKVNYRPIWLGRFKKKSDAIKARKAAELKYFSI